MDECNYTHTRTQKKNTFTHTHTHHLKVLNTIFFIFKKSGKFVSGQFNNMNIYDSVKIIPFFVNLDKHIKSIISTKCIVHFQRKGK